MPQFRADPAPAFAAARRAEAAGLDGVFVFDHLWPIGRPGDPALHGATLLAAIAQETSSIRIGTLVARTSLLPNAVLAHQLRTVAAIAGPGRMIAGVGAGDSLSRPENEAYGVPFAPAAARVVEMRDAAARLLDDGLEVWVGGQSAAVERVALELGVALNLWGLAPGELAARAASAEVDLTWGGTVDIARERSEVGRPRPLVMAGTIDEVARSLEEIAATGSTWAVFSPPFARGVEEEVDRVAEVVRAASGALGAPG